MSEVILEAKNLNRYYQIGEHELHVLKDVSFKIEEGKFYGIFGKVGAGKSKILKEISK